MPDPRRELDMVNDQLDAYQRTIGTSVLWASIDSAASVEDPVYAEPGARSYRRPVRVQVLWVNRTEGGVRYNPERTDTTSTIRLAVSARAMSEAGVPNVGEGSAERIGDIFQYRGAIWSVDQWDVLERIANDDVIVQIVGVETPMREEFPFEPTLPVEEGRP